MDFGDTGPFFLCKRDLSLSLSLSLSRSLCWSVKHLSQIIVDLAGLEKVVSHFCVYYFPGRNDLFLFSYASRSVENMRSFSEHYYCVAHE
jgi:hypothetical protein